MWPRHSEERSSCSRVASFLAAPKGPLFRALSIRGARVQIVRKELPTQDKWGVAVRSVFVLLPRLKARPPHYWAAAGERRLRVANSRSLLSAFGRAWARVCVCARLQTKLR